MLPVEFHPLAESEADAAFRWYRAGSPAAADAFKAELSRTVEAIRLHPPRFPPYLAGTRRGLLDRFPHLVVYVERTDRIQVIAVAHGKRRPGYWRRRVKGS